MLPAGNVYADLTAYYPFGLPFADWQGASRDLFSGKELERSGNLLDYDFHARRLDPQLLIFDKPDPLAANYPHLNPYLYCAANPVSLTDPSGRLIILPNSNDLYLLQSQVPPENRKALNLSMDNELIIDYSLINNTNSQNTIDLIYMNIMPDLIEFRTDSSYENYIWGQEYDLKEMGYCPIQLQWMMVPYYAIQMVR